MIRYLEKKYVLGFVTLVKLILPKIIWWYNIVKQFLLLFYIFITIKLVLFSIKLTIYNIQIYPLNYTIKYSHFM